MTDAKAFIGWLDKQSSVAKNRKVGTQGYCMGGPMAFRTAAAVPDRVGAVASFHGGGLVTDMPNSPHLEAAKSKAQFLIAIAANDDMRAPKDKDVLKETFAKANLPAEIEVYTGAAHGWCPPDSTVYNERTGREGLEPVAGAVRKSSGLTQIVSRAISEREFENSCEQESGGSPWTACRPVGVVDGPRASQALERSPAPNGPALLRHTTPRVVALPAGGVPRA